LLSRRELLRAAGLGTIAAGLAACAPAASVAPSGPAATPGRSPSPTPSPSVAPTPSPTPAVPLRSKIARLLVVGFEGSTIDEADAVAAAIADEGLGGVILFDRDQRTGGKRNIRSPDQLARLIDDLRSLAPNRTLLVAVDQEGGRVTRLGAASGFTDVASQAAIAGEGDDAVRAWAASIASTLASVGINVNLAPVVDLDINPKNPAIGALGRSFSADPAIVARLAGIEIQAHRDAGIRTTMKHFPGLGSASTNTDFGVADVTATWTRRELDPFRTLIERGLADSVMAGHLVNGQIDPAAPASLSHPTVTGVLRGELGWDGVVITDDLQAAAITNAFGRDEAIARALEAGDDLLLFANQQIDVPDITTRVVDLVARLVDDARLSEARIDESYRRVEAYAGGI
jgi:beta-N-acetylhexosaminidase